MRSPLHRDALSAWRHLREEGGLEIDDRDEGLEDRLIILINPAGANLEEALRSATNADLLRALFDVIHPYVAMFRDILDFFERAGAKEGRAQWNLQVDETIVGLEHFRRFLRQWDEVECTIEAPAVDQSGAWALFDETRDLPEMQQVGSHGGYLPGVPAIDRWLQSYRDGHYQPLPNVLSPDVLGPGYRDTAAVAAAALTVILAVNSERSAFMSLWRSRRRWDVPTQAYELDFVGQNETDFWLGTLVARLARAQTLPVDSKAALGARLQSRYEKYPRKKVGARLSLSQLTAILSLPLWKKRHELYAVWIGTEILAAVPDHDVEIHHQDGRIEFAFRETKVATIHSTSPEIRIVAERRIELDQPMGKGRVGAAQPDYGLWRTRPKSDICEMIIEVKHYKRAAARSFAEALADYARACPYAQIYLVNHGPVGIAADKLPNDVKERCHSLEYLMADKPLIREQLYEAVKRCVGRPVLRKLLTADTIIAIDVSSSMSSFLGSVQFEQLLDELIDERSEEAAAIDVKIRAIVPLEKAVETARSFSGSSTALKQPLHELFESYDRILLITDDDGLGDLKSFSQRRLPDLLPGLRIVELLKAPA
jgi:hypothetical protein